MPPTAGRVGTAGHPQSAAARPPARVTSHGGPVHLGQVVLAASVGIDRAYPEFDLYSLLNAEGEAAANKISKECLSEYAGQFPNKQLSEFTKPEYAEPLSIPRVENVLAAGSLPKGVPNTPVYAQGVADARAKARATTPQVDIGREHLFLRVEPGLSYVSDEFAEVDRVFWRGK